MVNWDGIKNERMLRTMIIRNLHKEYHPDTSSSIDYIYHLLEEAYNSGMAYDVSDLRQRVLIFAGNSSHQADRCMAVFAKMHFMSKDVEKVMDPAFFEAEEQPKYLDDRLVFFDCEVYPNLFVIVWKFAGDKDCHTMTNPDPIEVEELFNYKLVGFNCRKYDNHILYARSIGKSIRELYEISQQIINEGKGFFGAAYNISYTDIYDFSTEKTSLKKFEIKLNIHHQEMGIPWDKEVPYEMWNEVVSYCVNDVLATEAVFNYRHDDFDARCVQVDLVRLLHPEFAEEVSA